MCTTGNKNSSPVQPWTKIHPLLVCCATVDKNSSTLGILYDRGQKFVRLKLARYRSYKAPGLGYKQNLVQYHNKYSDR